MDNFKKNKLNKLNKITVLAFIILTVFFTSNSINAISEVQVSVTNNYEKDTVQANRIIKYDALSNLLLDNEGNDIEKVKYKGLNYDLSKVDITRYRQKVRIEYYLGDYTQSSLIGTDSGYADYDDSVRSYVKSIAKVNEDFNQTIPTTYKMVNYSEQDRTAYAYIPSYSEVKDEFVVKVLIAQVKTYTVSAYEYRNKQDKQNPNPIGKTRSEIDTLTDYWRFSSLSTNFSGVVGQTIDLKDVSQYSDSLTIAGKSGKLVHMGTYNSNSEFFETNSLVITDSLTGPVILAGFYEVEDYGSEVKNPGSSSSMTSGGSIGFVGPSNEWKSPTVTESLSINKLENYNKLKQYPFNLDDDPFDNPEHILDWLDNNWILNHKLNITYSYDLSATQDEKYVVKFETNGGSKISDIVNVSKDSLINAPSIPTKANNKFLGWYKDASLNNIWEFNKDKVASNITLYAKWGNVEIDDIEAGKGDGSIKDKLPKSGSKDLVILSLALVSLFTTLGYNRIIKSRKDS